MKKRKRQDLHRFVVEARAWGNSYYIERIAELEQALAEKPRTLQIEIVGTGEISADAALRFRVALMERSRKTRIVTQALSSLQNGSVLLWLLGDRRTIRDDARLFFRRTTLSDADKVSVDGGRQKDEPDYRDSYSEIDPEEGDYERVLEVINEYLPVKEMAGRLIDVPVLRQFGLIENETMDELLSAMFSKGSDLTDDSKYANKPKRAKIEKVRPGQLRK